MLLDPTPPPPAVVSAVLFPEELTLASAFEAAVKFDISDDNRSVLILSAATSHVEVEEKPLTILFSSPSTLLFFSPSQYRRPCDDDFQPTLGFA